MAKALQRRDVDRRTLSDYVLDELETFEVLGPGGAPLHPACARIHVVRARRHSRAQPGEVQRRARSANRSGANTRTTGSRRSRSAGRSAPSARPNARPEGEGAGARPGGVERAALRLRVLLPRLQVRAGQLLSRRPRNARQARRAAHRLLPHQPVRRRRGSKDDKDEGRRNPADAKDSKADSKEAASQTHRTSGTRTNSSSRTSTAR